MPAETTQNERVLNTSALAERTVLETDRLRLEQLGAQHFDSTWQYLQEEEGRRLTGTHQDFTEDAVRKFLARLPGSDERVDWAVILAVVAYAFDVVGLHRVSLGVYSFNPRAQRVYEKVGFIREGVARDALLWDGQWHDEVLMAMLSTDARL